MAGDKVLYFGTAYGFVVIVSNVLQMCARFQLGFSGGWVGR